MSHAYDAAGRENWRGIVDAAGAGHVVNTVTFDAVGNPLTMQQITGSTYQYDQYGYDAANQ